MFNQELAEKIVEYLREAFPSKVQFDELRSALPKFSDLSEEEWLKSLEALNHDGRIEFKEVRTGFDKALRMVTNIAITSAGRQHFRAQTRGQNKSVSEPRQITHPGLSVFISHSSKDSEHVGVPSYRPAHSGSE